MNCPICGGLIPPKSDKKPGPPAKYCSAACAKKAAAAKQLARWHKKHPDAGYRGKYKKELDAKRCQYCGKYFEPEYYNQIYCSDTCRSKAQCTPERRERYNQTRRNKRVKGSEPGRKKQKAKKHTFDDTLRMLQETGQSYAERQKAETIRMFAKIEIKK